MKIINILNSKLVFLIVFMLLITVVSVIDISADDPESECIECAGQIFPIMRFSQEELDEEILSLKNAPIYVFESDDIVEPLESTSSISLLSYIPYNPVERNQANCGNCWVWAGTACMEVDHNVNYGVVDRLSVQWFTSHFSLSNPGDPACCGGRLSHFAGFYESLGATVPWSNTNASWQDGNVSCPSGSNVHPEDIDIEMMYYINEMTWGKLPTHDVSQTQAINAIKTALHSRKPVYFSYYLPTDAAWDAFKDYWNHQTEDVIYDLSMYDGDDYDDGGGHAVVCVGYEDTGNPDTSYWIMLNSWGDGSGNRTNGLFRQKMYIDYDCSLDGFVSYEIEEYSLYWLVLDAKFDNHQPVAHAGSQYIAAENTTVMLDASGSYDPDDYPYRLSYRWDFDADGEWDTGLVRYPKINYTWCDEPDVGCLYPILEVSDGHLNDTATAMVCINNAMPIVDFDVYPSNTVDEGDMLTFVGSFTDPGCDEWTIEIDLGDGSPLVTDVLEIEHSYCDDGEYIANFTVCDDDGACGKKMAQVWVNNVPPVATIESVEQPNPQFILPIIHHLNFTGNISDKGCDVLTYSWDFGDGTIVTDSLTPTHIFSDPGFYTITLMVTDDDGDSGQDSITIEVVDELDALDDLGDYIQSLPDSNFSKIPNIFKKIMNLRIESIRSLLSDQKYRAATFNIRKNIKGKADGTQGGISKDDWIIDTDAQYHICMKIDDITSYISYL